MIRLRPTRLLAIGALALVAFLYWRPIHTYLRTKRALQTRHAQVHALSAEKASLEKKIRPVKAPTIQIDPALSPADKKVARQEVLRRGNKRLRPHR